MNVTLGTAPDSWGVWFPDDPKQTPALRFLDEVAEAGVTWIELGPYGYLPTDPDVLRRELSARGLKVTATFVMFPFEDCERWDAARDEVASTCELVASLGGAYLLLIDDVYTDLFTGELIHSAGLDDRQWTQLVETVEGISDLAVAAGLTPVFHPHAETHLEYEPQIERLLADTDSRLGLCLDVGHHAYRGGDPVAFARRYADRLLYLHLKSVDRDVQRKVEAEGIPFAEAVAIDMFVEPARGAVDFVALRAVLEQIGYDGFGIIEQDMYPAPFDKPLPIAKRTLDYLQGIGFGSVSTLPASRS
jgi:inosose dehydratase